MVPGSHVRVRKRLSVLQELGAGCHRDNGRHQCQRDESEDPSDDVQGGCIVSEDDYDETDHDQGGRCPENVCSTFANRFCNVGSSGLGFRNKSGSLGHDCGGFDVHGLIVHCLLDRVNTNFRNSCKQPVISEVLESHDSLEPQKTRCRNTE